MKTILLNLLMGFIIFSPNATKAQLKAYQFEQIDSLQKIEKKKIIVFIQAIEAKFPIKIFSWR